MQCIWIYVTIFPTPSYFTICQSIEHVTICLDMYIFNTSLYYLFVRSLNMLMCLDTCDSFSSLSLYFTMCQIIIHVRMQCVQIYETTYFQHILIIFIKFQIIKHVTMQCDQICLTMFSRPPHIIFYFVLYYRTCCNVFRFNVTHFQNNHLFYLPCIRVQNMFFY